MFGYETIELKDQHGKNFYFNSRKAHKKIREIEELLCRYKFLRSYSEPKREIREGIYGETSKQSRDNHTEAYQFLLTKPEITESNLHILYDILSYKQLDETSELEDRKSYRQKGVYILDTYHPLLLTAISGMDKGLEPDQVPKHMNNLFRFINRDDIDPFIKAQIAHFYFVYIHPFYDVNGRTARSLSSWSLINNNKKSYTIINRGISFTREEYLDSIKKSRKGDLTPFIDYSLDTVKRELLKQIELYRYRVLYNLSNEECETLELLLRLKEKDLDGLINSYYYQKGIYDRKLITEKILQLLEKNVISYNMDTKKITILDKEEKKKGYRRLYESRQDRKFY